MTPRVRVDEVTHVTWFRDDLSPQEIAELSEIVTQAFNVGLKSGYEQGKAWTSPATK